MKKYTRFTHAPSAKTLHAPTSEEQRLEQIARIRSTLAYIDMTLDRYGTRGASCGLRLPLHRSSAVALAVLGVPVLFDNDSGTAHIRFDLIGLVPDAMGDA